MTLFKTLIAAALVSMTAVTSAGAQSPWWPDVFDAQYPDRDLLNGGALTPAGRMGLELPGGAAPAAPVSGANNAYAANNAFAEMGSAGPSFRAGRAPSLLRPRNGQL